MADGIVLGVPPTVVNLVQQGLLERAFHDGLVPNFLYRADAVWEDWGDHQGTELFMTRRGMLAPVTKPLQPGVDPIPQKLDYEQWVAKLDRYGATIDTHMPTSTVANADLFLSNVKALGIQAGQSLNRLPRNAMFKAYLSGHTVLTQVTAAGDTVIRVASLNGFTDVVIKGTTVRPSPISSQTPLQISIMNGATAIVRNAIGFQPDNPDDPYGPGSLTLNQSVGAIVANRSAVLSVARPQIIRCGGGASIDAISASDTVTMQDVIVACNRLRRMNVPPHEDGTYHAHISTDGNTQFFTDPAFQRMLQGNPENSAFQEGFLGKISGVSFFQNNETPDNLNSGALSATGSFAQYAEDIGAEVVNESGVRIGRIIVSGKGVMYEKGLDESKFLTEAGVQGKVGEFSITNNGATIATERARLIIRAPQNRTQDEVAATWTISTCFPIPSDVVSGTPERFKRAVVIEHTLDG